MASIKLRPVKVKNLQNSIREFIESKYQGDDIGQREKIIEEYYEKKITFEDLSTAVSVGT